MEKILLIELAGIGDAILSTPAIRNLRKTHPDSSIYFVTLPHPAQLLKKSPYLNEVFILRNGLRCVLNNIHVLIKLRKLKIEVAVNLKQHYAIGGILKMYVLLKLIKPKQTIGRNTDGKGFIYDIKVKDKMDTQRSDVEYKLDLIRILGCEVKDKNLEVWFDQSDIKALNEFLRSNSVSDSDFLIGINPGAHRPAHRWSWQRFVAVADELAKKFNAKIIITGSKNESTLAGKVCRSISSGSIDTSGKLSLGQLIALISKCKLYISNDTGPMHIANALGVPLIAIMGAGSMKTAPFQRNKCVLLKKPVACSPCYKYRCSDLKCLSLISPIDVINAAENLVEQYVKD